jgi:hypothetical protein
MLLLRAGAVNGGLPRRPGSGSGDGVAMLSVPPDMGSPVTAAQYRGPHAVVPRPHDEAP